MAITERYVTTTGAGLHDGTSEANAFDWAEMVTDLNTPRVGYRYNVKQGTYSLSATTTLTGDGTTTSPNVIRGYATNIGDATLGRLANGQLDTSKMPTLEYGSTFRLNASGADHIILEALIVTATASNVGGISLSNTAFCVNCHVTNNGTSGTFGIEGGQITSEVNCCDVYVPAGGASSVGINAAGGVRNCRVKCNDGAGMRANDSTNIIGNTIYECERGINVTSGRTDIANNTIHGCTGDGIRVNSNTSVSRIDGNHITSNGGWGINFVTSTSAKFLTNNRFRNNTSGTITGDGDFGIATNQLNYTAGTSDDTEDYNDPTNDTYALKSTAVGYQKGLANLSNIGANGTPASSGGGGAKSYSFGL